MGRFTDAFGRALKRFDEPGPAIDVHPFTPGTVTTTNGILHAVRSVLAGRRDMANWRLQREQRQQAAAREALQTQELQQRVEGTTPLTQYQRSEIRGREDDRNLRAMQIDDAASARIAAERSQYVTVDPDYAGMIRVAPEADGPYKGMYRKDNVTTAARLYSERSAANHRSAIDGRAGSSSL